MAAFLVMLREGVEAALIVAILLAYLHRSDRAEGARWVWSGTLAAVAASLVVGIVLWTTIGGLEGTAEEVTEGVVAFAAAGLLTWMIFWMGRQARHMRAQLESRVEAASAGNGSLALAAIAFVAVLREGIESALFLISTTVGEASGPAQAVGAVLGLAAAIGVGVLVYRGSHLIDLRIFFRATGVLVLLFAAGLVAKGVHEFQEIGVLPVVAEHVWDLGVLEPDDSVTGRFLASLFGWTPAPSLLMVLSWLAYLTPVASVFIRMTARGPRAGSPRSPATAG